MTQPAEQERAMIDAFLEFIAGTVAEDDRYGPMTRWDRADGSVVAIRFDSGPSQWFEVAITPEQAEIRVGFVTSDPSIRDEIAEGIKESGEPLSRLVEAGFVDAGLAWPDLPVEHYQEENGDFHYAVPIVLEYFDDLDGSAIRDKTARMLEGMLVAFGPAIEFDEEDDAEEGP